MRAAHQHKEEGQVCAAPCAVPVEVGAQAHLVAVPAGVEGCGAAGVSSGRPCGPPTAPATQPGLEEGSATGADRHRALRNGNVSPCWPCCQPGGSGWVNVQLAGLWAEGQGQPPPVWTSIPSNEEWRAEHWVQRGRPCKSEGGEEQGAGLRQTPAQGRGRESPQEHLGRRWRACGLPRLPGASWRSPRSSRQTRRRRWTPPSRGPSAPGRPRPGPSGRCSSPAAAPGAWGCEDGPHQALRDQLASGTHELVTDLHACPHIQEGAPHPAPQPSWAQLLAGGLHAPETPTPGGNACGSTQAASTPPAATSAPVGGRAQRSSAQALAEQGACRTPRRHPPSLARTPHTPV